MLGPRGVHHADQLRAMLDAEALPEAGPVELTHGTLETVALAVRIVLADVDHLTYLPRAGPWVEARRIATEADLETLRWLAATWPSRR